MLSLCRESIGDVNEILKGKKHRGSCGTSEKSLATVECFENCLKLRELSRSFLLIVQPLNSRPTSV